MQSTSSEKRLPKKSFNNIYFEVIFRDTSNSDRQIKLAWSSSHSTALLTLLHSCTEKGHQSQRVTEEQSTDIDGYQWRECNSFCLLSIQLDISSGNIAEILLFVYL
ncbi:hypothetical protein GOODEAATRI_008555 [Goodea atripinnis]|uniref:Uncharacterized protein n=1 Tax=Goodea atripinnis TaxID=208336 RepID=A0ABV0PCJ0_9TELE